MLPLLLLLMALCQTGSVGQRLVPVVSTSAVGGCERAAWGRLHRVRGLVAASGVQWVDAGMLRLRGGGRAWIRKTIKAASKKERQRKKRNIDGTNLRASVKLDPSAVPPGLLLKNELDNQALMWLTNGCHLDALPTVVPLQAIEEAMLRLQALPDKAQRIPRTIKSRQQEEDAKVQDGKHGAAMKDVYDDVGSQGSRAVKSSKSARGLVSAALHKSSIKKSAHIKQGARSSNKGGGMRLRGGGPDMSDEESSSVVSDATSSVVSSASSSAFALPGESPAPAKTSTRGQAAAGAKSQTTTKVAAHDLSAQLSNLAVGKSEPIPKTSKSSGARVDSSSVDTSLDSSHSSADVAPQSRIKKIDTSDKSPTSVVGKDSGSIKKDAKTPQPSPSDRGEEEDGEFEMGAASSSVSGSDDPSSDDDGAKHSADSDESSSDTDMESSSTEDEDDDSSMQGDEGVRGEEDEDGVRQGRLVTQLRTNPAAMGLFFDLEVVGKEHIELTAFATASHITCRHPLDLEIFICEGGCDSGVDGQSDEPIWYSIFEVVSSSSSTPHLFLLLCLLLLFIWSIPGACFKQWNAVICDLIPGNVCAAHTLLSAQQPNSTALPRMWECEPASPSEYGVLRLEQPLPLAPGERIGVCIRTSHPDGLVLRALRKCLMFQWCCYVSIDFLAKRALSCRYSVFWRLSQTFGQVATLNMTVSTQNATPTKSFQSKNSASSVSRDTNPN